MSQSRANLVESPIIADISPTIFSAQDADIVGTQIDVSKRKSFTYSWDKSGAGTCTITFKWSIDGTKWETIPKDGSSLGAVYSVGAGAQDGYHSVFSLVGYKYTRAEISGTAGVISVNMIFGANNDV